MKKILISLNIVMIIAIIVLFTLNNVEEKEKTMLIFIEIKAADSDIETLKKQILNIKNIKIDKYKTKEDIKQEMIAENDNLEEIIEGYGDNLPFNPILTLKISSKVNSYEISKKIKELDNVYDIIYENKNS